MVSQMSQARFQTTLWVAAGVLWATTGCGVADRHDHPARAEAPPPANQGRGPTPRCAANSLEASLESMSRQLASGLAEEETAYKNAYIRHGLVPPTHVAWAIRAADPDGCPRRKLLTERVREAVIEECSRRGDLIVHHDASSHELSGLITVTVATDFEMPFEQISCLFQLELGGTSRTYRTRFNMSDGLVCIESPWEYNRLLIVSAQRENFAADFHIRTGAWFLMPQGPYRSITVRTPNGLWAPPTKLVGRQTYWHISPLSPRQDEAARGPGNEAEQPHLFITSPRTTELVAQTIAISGLAVGLEEGSGVEVHVLSTEVGYRKRRQAVVRDGGWQVPVTIYAHYSGASFEIHAAAVTRDGQLIRSPSVTVARP